jgi:hypothetical protein
MTLLPQLDVAGAVSSSSSAILSPLKAAAARSSTGVLHFHSHNANIVIERFALGKLANVADDAVEKFLGRKASVTTDGCVQLVLREECAGSIFHFE